jgi:hypothetical protein
MALSKRTRGLLGAGALTALVAGIAVPAAASSGGVGGARMQHVLLISVDGLHQTDLAWYVATHPNSTLAQLTGSGIDYSNASTPFPSDSFPGMVGQVTGGNPATTGVYYDDTWNHALISQANLPPNYDPRHPDPALCKGVAPGVEVTYFEQLDVNQHSIDAGQGLAGLPGSILNMTSNPLDVIDPTQLPVDPTTCAPVYPSQYVKVNNIFEVARQHGLRTAWSDKHPAYEILDGPSRTGVQDFFTPEINSASPCVPGDWTGDNSCTAQYDGYKVQAVLNWIDGLDHSGHTQVGTPNIFGMNFQTVSTGEKLLKSHLASDQSRTGPMEAGGYLADGFTPGPVLTSSLDFVDASLGKMVAELKKVHLDDSTTIVVSAKHGQSPQDPAALKRIDDGAIISAINAAWGATHINQNLIVFGVDDDGMLLWTSDQSPEATSFVKTYLLTHNAQGTDITGAMSPVPASGLTQVYAGQAAADLIGVPVGDPRVPDVIGIAQVGTVYTTGSKIAEHGGDNPQDRDVPILVSGPTTPHDRMNTSPVETTQIAPTILQLLGLNPQQLQAVHAEGTQVLPGM